MGWWQQFVTADGCTEEWRQEQERWNAWEGSKRGQSGVQRGSLGEQGPRASAGRVISRLQKAGRARAGSWHHHTCEE